MKNKNYLTTIRQNKIIRKIRKTMERTDSLKFLKLNCIKEEAAQLVFYNKISATFYKNVFLNGSINTHWSEINKNYILNYEKIFKKNA